MEDVSSRTVIKQKLRENFDGKIVAKDLTKKIKEGANVPVYVLEFLLGQYCSSDDEEIIEKGVATVKKILSDNFVRPDEAQKILSILREKGSFSIIDKVIVGEIDENGDVDPYKLTFVYKTGFKDDLDGDKFKSPRKNASSKNKRIGKDSAELSTYTSNHINKSSSHSSDTTCGDSSTFVQTRCNEHFKVNRIDKLDATSANE